MKSTAVKVWLAVLLSAVCAYGAYTLNNVRRANSTARPVPQPSEPTLGYEVGDFTLTTREGQEFHARDLHGQVWVASFFYSECPGACITLNNHIAEMLTTDFADSPVKFVSISVDPTKDTIEELNKYASHFVDKNDIDPQRWIFLTDPSGKTDRVKAVSRQFKLSYGKLTHSDRLMLVDREGRVQGTYQSSFPAEVAKLRQKLSKMLKEEQGGATEGSDPQSQET